MSSPSSTWTRFTFGLAFFLFGLLNNVLYVVILSAALDLVEENTPKGLILFVNIAPALFVKIVWPYLLSGRVRYSRRVVSCSAISFAGITIVAVSSTLFGRLSGILMASFSSGLGEMTFLQLALVYGSIETVDPTSDLASLAISQWSSGTGFAGLIGSLLWWTLRSLGVKEALLISSVLPLSMLLVYFLLLPPTTAFARSTMNYSSVATSDEGRDEESSVVRDAVPAEKIALTIGEKMLLARPLLSTYMLPLFFVYFAEYTINTGVAPTLVYPVPSTSPFLSNIIKIRSLRDYYPLWQLVYQTFVFFSRSSLSIFRLPPLPISLLPLPAIVQIFLLCVTSMESSLGFLESSFGSNNAIYCVFCLIALEGISGGLAYVNVFYHLGVEQVEIDERKSAKRRLHEREFRIASVSFSDSIGILCASLVASLLEPALCNAQVARGRNLCREV